MDLRIFILVASSFSSFGILTLWAVTSERHWFLRSAVYLAVLSLLLLIPAAALFILFASQGFVIFNAVIWPLKQKEQNRLPRFSLADMLLATPLVAVVVLIIRSYRLNPTDLMGSPHPLFVLGWVPAMNALLAHWWMEAEWRLARKSALSLLLLSIGTALGVRFGSPLTSMGSPLNQWFADAELLPTIACWFALNLTVFLIVLSVKQLALIPRWNRWLLGGGTFVVSLPSLFCFYLLMTPLPIPPSASDDDRSFQQLVDAGEATDCIEFGEWTQTPIDKLAIEITKRDGAFTQAEELLAQNPVVSVRFTQDDIDTDSAAALRTLARAFAGRARWKAETGDIDGAIDDQLRIVEIGKAAGNGGLLVNWFIGIAIDQLGKQELHGLRQHLNRQQCQRILRRVEEIHAARDPISDMLYRERVWSERSFGWFGHLTLLLEEGSFDPSSADGTNATLELTRHRLFMGSIAVRGYSEQHGTPPLSLDQLVPEFLSEAPTDPFDANNRPLCYVRDGGEFTLYSVGPNGTDDGGATDSNLQGLSGVGGADDLSAASVYDMH